MLNYWWVTRPKRRLNSIPEVLACCASVSLDQEWRGSVYTHLAFEEALERAGLKRIGERRDRRGGGGRTYYAWLFSLGLVFTHKETGQTKLTLAGEAIMNGEPPTHVLKSQILKYQFPSPFSLSETSSKSRVNARFKIRPFQFLLRLFRERKLGYYLTQEEIAKIIITEAETDKSYDTVVEKLLLFRDLSDACLDADFSTKYAPSTGKVNPNHPFSHLVDVANTIINWLDYAQFISRDDGVITLLPEKIPEVDSILNNNYTFIDRPHEPEYFQRKYGLDPKHLKDTRNLSKTHTVTPRILDEQKVKQAYIAESLKSPITKITSILVEKVSSQTGIDKRLVEDILCRLYPNGSIGSFMTEYFEMAFKGRDEATDFEIATAELFRSVFGFETAHIGATKLKPDVLIFSDREGYIGIIDNKAYSKYSISNDHRNRMVHNYIRAYTEGQRHPLAFFSYISGGFGINIDMQIRSISDETGVNGSAMSVSNMINLVEHHSAKSYDHGNIRDIFSLNRQVLMSDL